MTEPVQVTISTKHASGPVILGSTLVGVGTGLAAGYNAWDKECDATTVILAGFGGFILGFMLTLMPMESGKRQSVLSDNPDACFKAVMETKYVELDF
jgi:hypothetical protein